MIHLKLNSFFINDISFERVNQKISNKIENLTFKVLLKTNKKLVQV